MIIKGILLAVLLLFCLISGSQPQRFKHLTSADGISQSEIYTFLEDSRGFMWFGTVDGLNRYDGYHIQIFNTNRNDLHSLSNNTIRCLTEDQSGRIWIGTDNGLNLYDPQTELICQIRVNSFQNKSMPVWSILIDDGYLLLGTEFGLWKTNIKTKDLKEIELGFQQITNYKNSNNIVRSLIQSKQGGVWVLTPESFSRIVFQHSTNVPVVVEEISFKDFSFVVSSIQDFSGNIWIASSRNGLIRYNPETKQTTHFTKYGTSFATSSENISALTRDNNGNLWIGTQDKGLNFVKKETLNNDIVLFESIQNDPTNLNSLNSNLIYSLYVTKSNQIWVGTIGSGVNIYNPEQKKFEQYKFYDLTGESPISNFIRAVYVDDQNRIWSGTHNNGLFLYDRNNETFQKLGFETNSVFYIENYKENKNFICSAYGISLVELVNNKLKILSQSSIFYNSAVFYVTRSKSDIYWYAANSGLVRASIVNNKIVIDKVYTKTTNPCISNSNCRVLFYDKDLNNLLVGTEGGGLNIVSLDTDQFPKDVQIYKKNEDPNSLSNNYVRSIFKDNNHNIWIGTYEGLNKMILNSVTGKYSFKTYTTKDGLPNNMIQLIVEDNNHCLWIGTNGGLSQFFPSEERFINYTVNDGLQSNEFSEHTVFKKPDGEIIIGGINGINAFYPEQIKVSTIKPRTTLTGFYLFNKKVKALEKVGRKSPLDKSITLTDTIKLLPNQKNFGFDFSAMIYPNAEKIQYAYMLEGFDNEWHYTDANNRNANYTNLRHGKYTFKVKSTNTDGIWEDLPREVFIQIQTPFFYTWFAYLLYLAAIVLIFKYFSVYSIMRYSTKKKLLFEKTHNEKLHELDVLRTKFFINISHDLRTPVTLISGPLDSILQNKNLKGDIKEKLELIKRNVKRLNYLVEQLLDVRKSEFGKLTPKLKSEDILSFTENETSHFAYAVKKKGLELKIKNELENKIVSFDSSMLSKVYFNIISNAIKYTDKGEITIHIYKTDRNSFDILKESSFNSFIVTEISDTGRGIPKEQIVKIFDRFYQTINNEEKGYGIGLSHTKELIEAHLGFIEAESTIGKGTMIRFFLPNNDSSIYSKGSSASSTEDIYFDTEPNEIGEEIPERMNAQSILIVEDNIDMRSYIKNELKKIYNVLEAVDGLDGLKKAEDYMPDLIVCDVMMPNMDGIELCEKLKSNLGTSHIPLILLTAKVDLETKYEGIETGADDYIPKPFEMEYLQIRIKNLLHSREQLRMLFQKNKFLEPSAVTVTTIDEKFLSLLMESIEEGIPDSEFSIVNLESKMGMSHANFYRKIKSITGQSGQELLLDMRMKRAYQILSEKKGIRVSEVAYMIGFTNPKYFSKCFKEMYGHAPTEINK